MGLDTEMMPHFSEGDVARYWDANADLWTEHVRRGWDAYREHLNNPAFFAFLGDVSGKVVLDAGCGEGRNTRLLAKAGATVTGIDISPRMIQHAREAEANEPLGIRYEVASFSDLAIFEEASFDLVVSFMALMDGPDYEGALGAIFRALRPGGEAVFSLSHPCFMTRGYGWIRDEDEDGGALTVSHYFEDAPQLEYWRFSKGPIPPDTKPFAVPCFPRTLTQYINGVIQAGLVLEAIHEPRPNEETCARHPWLRRYRDHATIFLYIRAAKP